MVDAGGGIQRQDQFNHLFLGHARDVKFVVEVFLRTQSLIGVDSVVIFENDSKSGLGARNASIVKYVDVVVAHGELYGQFIGARVEHKMVRFSCGHRIHERAVEAAAAGTRATNIDDVDLCVGPQAHTAGNRNRTGTRYIAPNKGPVNRRIQRRIDAGAIYGRRGSKAIDYQITL
jgi:hypothetical protein